MIKAIKLKVKVGACEKSLESAVKIARIDELPEEDEDALMAEVAKAPVASAMHIKAELKDYAGGVYENEDCPTRCDARRVQFSFHKIPQIHFSVILITPLS